MNQDLIESPGAESIFSLVPRDLKEAMEFAKLISDTDFIPKEVHASPRAGFGGHMFFARVGPADRPSERPGRLRRMPHARGGTG